MEIQVREYLTDPPSADEIERVLRQLHLEPRDLMRRGEDAYRASHADDVGLSRAALVGLMHAHPILIERPVVIVGDHARVGRPPEAVLEIL